MKINKIMVVLLVVCSLLSVYSLLVVNSKTKEAEAQCVDLWQPGMTCGLITQKGDNLASPANDEIVPVNISCLGQQIVNGNDLSDVINNPSFQNCPSGFRFSGGDYERGAKLFLFTCIKQ